MRSHLQGGPEWITLPHMGCGWNYLLLIETSQDGLSIFEILLPGLCWFHTSCVYYVSPSSLPPLSLSSLSPLSLSSLPPPSSLSSPPFPSPPPPSHTDTMGIASHLLILVLTVAVCYCQDLNAPDNCGELENPDYSSLPFDQVNRQGNLDRFCQRNAAEIRREHFWVNLHYKIILSCKITTHTQVYSVSWASPLDVSTENVNRVIFSFFSAADILTRMALLYLTLRLLNSQMIQSSFGQFFFSSRHFRSWMSHGKHRFFV